MKRQKPMPPPRAITIERDGVRHTGHFTVQSGVVSVSDRMDSKSTQIGGSSADAVAKALLSELVRGS
jgi:hypothetical protein